MADLKENEFATGTPTYLRGIASNGNGIRVTRNEAKKFVGIFYNEYSVEAKEEMDLGQLEYGYGLYVLFCPEIGLAATYVIASYPIQSNNPSYFGDYISNPESSIVFGRKETNGNFFLKNNMNGTSTVRIIRIYA